MTLLGLAGLLMPLLAAAGWLWWIYQSDRFEKEPWALVLKLAAAGAGGGMVTLVLSLILFRGLEGITGALESAAAETGLHLLGVVVPLYLLGYRDPNWNEPFDGLVYGGAAGVGYGLVFTLPAVAENPEFGYRVAIFSMPVYMLVGIILGHYLSRAKFRRQPGRLSNWFQGLVIAGAFLIGIDLALRAGGEVVSGRNLLAGLMAYGSNTLAWLIAARAMALSHQTSPFNPEAYRLALAPRGCPSCRAAYPVGAVYCNACGLPVQHESVAAGSDPAVPPRIMLHDLPLAGAPAPAAKLEREA